MEWRDEGIVLATRRHGEGSVIAEVLTVGHGRHAGLVRGGAGRRLAPHLQPGTDVAVTWRARLEDHLGNFTVEPVRSRAALLGDPLALAGLGAMAAMMTFALPEREPVADLHARSQALLEGMLGRDWLAGYAHWELALLTELGFGLDLSSCAATGSGDDLIWVSPRSGRAVSRSAGTPWADRLLPLPAFLIEGGAPDDPAAIAAALHLTGFFLQSRLCPALGKPSLPPARERFLQRLARS